MRVCLSGHTCQFQPHNFRNKLCAPAVLLPRSHYKGTAYRPLLDTTHSSTSAKHLCFCNEGGDGAYMARATARNTVLCNMHQPSLLYSQ